LAISRLQTLFTLKYHDEKYTSFLEPVNEAVSRLQMSFFEHGGEKPEEITSRILEATQIFGLTTKNLETEGNRHENESHGRYSQSEMEMRNSIQDQIRLSVKSRYFPYAFESDKLGALEVSDSKSKVIEEISEGILRKIEKEKPVQHLIAYLDAEEVPEDDRDAIIKKIKIEIARVTRPKWVGRLERGGELATLSAPLFLTRVHADYIGEDGTVENETIRALDSDLMNAVEIYMAQRRSYAKRTGQPLDMKDAEGLNFILSRPKARGRNAKREYNVK